MIKIILLILILLIALAYAFYWLITSNSSVIIYEGAYNNKPVKVRAITTPGFERNILSHSVQYGDLTPVKINYATTDAYGVPYDISVFANSKSTYIDNSYQYQNEQTFDNLNTVSMLYLSKNDFSSEEYIIYEDFFKHHWLKIQQKLLNKDNSYFYTHITGVVHGDRKDFIKIFNGVDENYIVELQITPDGNITLYRTGKNPMFISSGLVNKVQMPGKILQKNADGYPLLINYDTFKDKEGKGIKDYFSLNLEK